MEELYEKLHALKDGAGDFASSGCLPQLPLPGLFIKDVGDISLPVQDEEARKIIAVAKKAPYGLGEKTIIDESVRKSWELSPSEIVIKNQQFDHAVKTVVESVKESLGCVDKCVQLHLYKLLLYEKGGHFKPHRDTEKQKGMFATMIIQLPSLFEGGKLIVRHQGMVREVHFDGEESPYCCKYAAHYSDCEHEVTEITSGNRLALVYSLCWSATGAPPASAASAEFIQNIAAIIPTVCTEKRKKFVWFLAHRYSSAGLSGNGKSALKGHDASVAKVFQAANEVLPEEKKFDFHIAVVTRTLEQYGDCHRYRGRGIFGIYGDFEPNGNEYEEINVERQWFKLDGAEQKMGEVNVDFENEVVNYRCPDSTNIEDYKNEFWGDASNEDFMGPTGNAGASQTYWYQNCAIFAWPKANTFYLMCESGYDAAVEWLANEFSRLKHYAADHPNYQKALGDLRVALNFPISKPVSLNSSLVCSILSILAELRADASELANLFLTEVIAKGVFNRWSDTKVRYCLGDDDMILPLVRVIVAIGSQSISDAVMKMFKLSPVSQYGRWAVFLKKLLENNGAIGCFNTLVLSLVNTVEFTAQSKTTNAANAATWITEIASLLFAVNDAEILNKFTDAVHVFSVQFPDSAILEKLTAALENENLGSSPYWIKLLQWRIRQLEKVEEMGTKSFTWNQYDAVVPGHSQVQAFLRGPEQRMTYQAFTSIRHARNWANKHSWSNTYSITVTTGGTGQRSYALIEKTRAWYDKKMKTIQHNMKDLSKLRAMVNGPANTDGDSTIDALEPPVKKQAAAVIFID